MNLSATIVILAFVAVCIGCGDGGSSSTGPAAGEDRYLPAGTHQEKLESQLAMCGDTIKALRAAGVDAGRDLRLEYFFYSDRLEKVEKLAGALRGLGYSAECGPSAGDEAVMLVTGWTTKMPMDDETVLDWVRAMCAIGFEHDCEFDGWGTNPDQE